MFKFCLTPLYKVLGASLDFAFWPFIKYGHLFKNLVETMNMEMLRLMPLGASAVQCFIQGHGPQTQSTGDNPFSKCHASYRKRVGKSFQIEDFVCK